MTALNSTRGQITLQCVRWIALAQLYFCLLGYIVTAAILITAHLLKMYREAALYWLAFLVQLAQTTCVYYFYLGVQYLIADYMLAYLIFNGLATAALFVASLAYRVTCHLEGGGDLSHFATPEKSYLHAIVEMHIIFSVLFAIPSIELHRMLP